MEGDAGDRRIVFLAMSRYLLKSNITGSYKPILTQNYAEFLKNCAHCNKAYPLLNVRGNPRQSGYQHSNK